MWQRSPGALCCLCWRVSAANSQSLQFHNSLKGKIQVYSHWQLELFVIMWWILYVSNEGVVTQSQQRNSWVGALMGWYKEQMETTAAFSSQTQRSVRGCVSKRANCCVSLAPLMLQDSLSHSNSHRKWKGKK